MGGGSSTLTAEQRRQVQQLLEQWANNQDNQSNAALRTQYTRITTLMNQFNDRLTDRQNASQDRLERQVKELKEQLEKMQSKVESKDEAGPSGNRINDILNDLANTLKPALDEKSGKPFMNQPGPMMGGSQGFGPCTMSPANYGAQHFGYQGYHQGPYVPNPSMQQPPMFRAPYHPREAHPPYQQHPPMGAHPRNPYFPPNFNPNQYHQNQGMNAPNILSQPPQNQSANEKKIPSKVFKASAPKPKKQQPNLNKEVPKDAGPKIHKTTKPLQESGKDLKTAKQKTAIKLEDLQDILAKVKEQKLEGNTGKPSKTKSNGDVQLEDIEKIIAKFKEQKLETETGKASKDVKKNTQPEKQTGGKKNEDGAKKNQQTAKHSDKTESGDRRFQYKARGRGRDSQEQWKYKNREARKKSYSRNIDCDEADSDSNESVASTISCASKATTRPADKNKKIFWTTRPDYARSYNFERIKLKLECATQGLDLKNYSKPKTEEKSDSAAQSAPRAENGSLEKKPAKPAEQEEKANENKPSTSRDSNVKVMEYPSEAKATDEGIDVLKPLERPVLFVALTETGEHRTHHPTCLADIYMFEKMYKNFQLISLT